MEHMPFVSIITITHNRANLIYKCIKSIQSQTYKNYEHIIVDGNSTDNTKEVVESYAISDKKIKYIHLDYSGPSQQQLQGFLVAKGEYITFLDDDDEYLPDNLEKKIEIIEELDDSYGFIYGPMDYFDAQTGNYLYTHEAGLEGGEELLPQAIANAIVCGTPSIMYRRNALEDIGGTYIRGIGNEMSDWALSLKALSRGWKVKAYEKSLVKVYVNHGLKRLTTDCFKDLDGLRRQILFANHFLTEYEEVIRNHPTSAIVHLKTLLNAQILLKNYREGFKTYYQLIKCSPSMKHIVYPFYLILIKNWLGK